MNPRVKEVLPIDNYKLRITFTNNECKTFDCNPYLEIGVFRELKNNDYFERAMVADGTVVWPHEQDFCPDTLYRESV